MYLTPVVLFQMLLQSKSTAELPWLSTGAGLSLLCRGTQMEKLKAAYDMMDRSGSGRIPRATMSAWLATIQRLGGVST